MTQYLLAHEPMCMTYTLRDSGTSASSANDTLLPAKRIALMARFSDIADFSNERRNVR